ncbi:MAG TPA: hypothetical protein VH701_27140 [Vicinamibacterales bacterium]|jgi:hypothetical protein
MSEPWSRPLDAQRGEQGRPGGAGPGGRGRGPAGPPQLTQVTGDLYKVQTGPGVQPVTVFLVTSEGIILADPRVEAFCERLVETPADPDQFRVKLSVPWVPEG